MFEISRLSKVSRIWKKKIPKIKLATSTSSAMPNSTTSGMPWVALVAAKNRLFSRARKATTWVTALRRVSIISNDSSTPASAMPINPRVMPSVSCEIGAARLKAKITSAMPTSMVVGMLIRVSTSQRTFSLRIKRCSNHGNSSTFSASVNPAE